MLHCLCLFPRSECVCFLRSRFYFRRVCYIYLFLCWYLVGRMLWSGFLCWRMLWYFWGSVFCYVQYCDIKIMVWCRPVIRVQSTSIVVKCTQQSTCSTDGDNGGASTRQESAHWLRQGATRVYDPQSSSRQLPWLFCRIIDVNTKTVPDCISVRILYFRFGLPNFDESISFCKQF